MKLVLLLLGIVFLLLGIIAVVATGLMGFVVYIPLLAIGAICLIVRSKKS